VEESLALRSPLRVVQARHSGFVQLAHVYDLSLYRQYSFSGGGSAAYRKHLTHFAATVAQQLPKQAYILEVGCGDGWLLRQLRELGYENVFGIDPSKAARENRNDFITSGFFPEDMPAALRGQKFDLIITRHVLEHIEAPRPFMTALANALTDGGQLWIEVPDLTSTVQRRLWSNFYQLHCGYYSAETMDSLAATAGLRCREGRIVEVFGGSLLRKYARGDAITTPAPPRLDGLHREVDQFRASLAQLSALVPVGSVGYGAAERTAVTLGHAPALAARLERMFDGNRLLTDRYLAGTALRIEDKEALFRDGAPAVLLFAISNATEILAEWKQRLPADTLVGVVGGEFILQPLRRFP